MYHSYFLEDSSYCQTHSSFSLRSWGNRYGCKAWSKSKKKILSRSLDFTYYYVSPASWTYLSIWEMIHFLCHTSNYWQCQSMKKSGIFFFPHEVRSFSICHNMCPHIFTLKNVAFKLSQGRLFLFDFYNFYAAAARSFLGICFEFCLQCISHCFRTDLGYWR